MGKKHSEQQGTTAKQPIKRTRDDERKQIIGRFRRILPFNEDSWRCDLV